MSSSTLQMDGLMAFIGYHIVYKIDYLLMFNYRFIWGGKKPKFLAPSDKHNVNEGETVFVTFKVEGDPAPTAEWFKVPEKDMSCNPRLTLFLQKIVGGIGEFWHMRKQGFVFRVWELVIWQNNRDQPEACSTWTWRPKV